MVQIWSRQARELKYCEVRSCIKSRQGLTDSLEVQSVKIAAYV